jgi:hypothetical protein
LLESVVLYRNLGVCYILYGLLELPTFIMSLGSTHPHLRQDLAFGVTFFLCRIVWLVAATVALLVIEAPIPLLLLVVPTALVLLLHCWWFSKWWASYSAAPGSGGAEEAKAAEAAAAAAAAAISSGSSSPPSRSALSSSSAGSDVHKEAPSKARAL